VTRRRAAGKGRGPRSAFLLVFGVLVGALATSLFRGCVKRPEPTTPVPKPTAVAPTPGPPASSTARPARVLPSDFEPADRRTAGVVAIVIDDIGFESSALSSLASLDAPLALAVIPRAPHAGEAARLAREKGWDLLVHLPMDPESGRAEKDSLGPKDGDDAIRDGVLGALSRVPAAIGINNHQGSKATADARVMRDVLAVVKDKGLFFLDSRTSSSSVVGAEAEKLGVPFLARDVFLDDAATEAADPGGPPGALDAAWTRGVALAKKRGQAIVIGHPRRETLAFLSEKIGLLGKEGPKLVRVSELVP
jgi:uncharacterized protein